MYPITVYIEYLVSYVLPEKGIDQQIRLHIYCLHTSNIPPLFMSVLPSSSLWCQSPSLVATESETPTYPLQDTYYY